MLEMMDDKAKMKIVPDAIDEQLLWSATDTFLIVRSIAVTCNDRWLEPS